MITDASTTQRLVLVAVATTGKQEVRDEGRGKLSPLGKSVVDIKNHPHHRRCKNGNPSQCLLSQPPLQKTPHLLQSRRQRRRLQHGSRTRRLATQIRHSLQSVRQRLPSRFKPIIRMNRQSLSHARAQVRKRFLGRHDKRKHDPSSDPASSGHSAQE